MKALRWLCVPFIISLYVGNVHAENEGDPHYTPAGFFDIHVCNWPDEPRFLMALFSTPRFDEVAKVAVYAPDGRYIADLDLSRFRSFKSPSGQPKRAFIAHLKLPSPVVDGWYRAEITLKDGSLSEAQDYVIHRFMDRATGAQPADGARDVRASTELRWNPIPGARYYEVFLRDEWSGAAPIESGLLPQPRFVPPPGMLRPGGVYVWRVHARDSDGNVLLGDFNHGSLSSEMRFTVE